jgi:predicted ATPase
VRIALHNVGPIRDANVTLAPLTVLVGPNGSGKTTLSTIAYAVLLAQRQASRRAGIGVLRRAALRADPDLDSFARRVLENWEEEFREGVDAHLQRCFGPYRESLAREGRSGKGAAPRIIVSSTGRIATWKMVFRLDRDRLVLERSHTEYVAPALPDIEARTAAQYESQIRRVTTASFAARSVYLPAARSGFMQMNSALAALFTRALEAGYFEHATLGTISGTTSDFLQFVSTIQGDQESTLEPQVVAEIEEATTGGQFVFERGSGSQGLRFKPSGLTGTWPLAYAATSAAEIAPLVLYLRHRAQHGDALFIDEPEAHLHPRTQMVLADRLLNISRSIHSVTIATHSEFIVSAISNGMLSSHIADQEPFGRGDVRVYEFCPEDNPLRGVDVKELRYDPRVGFDIRQFSSVAEAAYEHSVALYNEIHSTAS